MMNMGSAGIDVLQASKSANSALQQFRSAQVPVCFVDDEHGSAGIDVLQASKSANSALQQFRSAQVP
ncbi:unnamed protein product [Calypogeia fissa]